MTGDEITCENCGEVVERRHGEWTHSSLGGFYERCWPNKEFFAFPNSDDLNNENESEEA